MPPAVGKDVSTPARGRAALAGDAAGSRADCKHEGGRVAVGPGRVGRHAHEGRRTRKSDRKWPGHVASKANDGFGRRVAGRGRREPLALLWRLAPRVAVGVFFRGEDRVPDVPLFVLSLSLVLAVAALAREARRRRALERLVRL
jgi:hypothetical protein